jgi:hypothetical protein
MENRETAKPAHRDGGGPRDLEQLAGQLEITNSAIGSAPQARTDFSAPDHRARRDVTTGICRECNAKFEARRASREFCCNACRQQFNNRRMTRGLEIYDFAMAWRDDRTDTMALTLLCRLLAEFKDEDSRAGRVSWNSAAGVIRDKPYLAAVLLDTNVAGMRRRKAGR